MRTTVFWVDCVDRRKHAGLTGPATPEAGSVIDAVCGVFVTARPTSDADCPHCPHCQRSLDGALVELSRFDDELRRMTLGLAL
ncbi:hypothetical protein [Amycolatopsis anabasis]|uniref:hypothetical protein n=1 Tax=Amycolatopsis anabasis TaxID=1840409 RepID=UPI00131AAB1C|nr:hypothetical protein [Amycolatopsis anabasis]